MLKRYTLFLFLFTICVQNGNTKNPSRYSYASLLLSDDFLLPTRVFAFALQRATSNRSIPLIIYCTEDVRDATIETLNREGIRAVRTESISGPETENVQKYAKFEHWTKQFTKFRLWTLMEYDQIVYLDLDTLPLADLSEMFYCGDFCAALRHSDMFNGGVFVLKPNMTVFEDLVEKSSQLLSYDGGDQGFFNLYFHQLKNSQMFDPESKNHENSGLHPLPSIYNYDIGMYYWENGLMLIQPKVIHFTLGPIKPWIWWTYPMFDLNWQWNEIRWLSLK